MAGPVIKMGNKMKTLVCYMVVGPEVTHGHLVWTSDTFSESTLAGVLERIAYLNATTYKRVVVTSIARLDD